MEETNTRKGGVSAFKKRIKGEIQGKGREKKKAAIGRDQKYNNRGAGMEICEFRQEISRIKENISMEK